MEKGSAGYRLMQLQQQPRQVGMQGSAGYSNGLASKLVSLSPSSSASASSSSSQPHEQQQQGGGGGGLKKGPWSAAEDKELIEYVRKYGEGNWNAVRACSGLRRCGKSCRLRWTNQLRPDLRRDRFTPAEEARIVLLQSIHGNKWARIAAEFPGRTDNAIKNLWNTRNKRLKRQAAAAAANSNSSSSSSSTTAIRSCSLHAANYRASRLTKTVGASFTNNATTFSLPNWSCQPQQTINLNSTGRPASTISSKAVSFPGPAAAAANSDPLFSSLYSLYAGQPMLSLSSRDQLGPFQARYNHHLNAKATASDQYPLLLSSPPTASKLNREQNESHQLNASTVAEFAEGRDKWRNLSSPLLYEGLASDPGPSSSTPDEATAAARGLSTLAAAAAAFNPASISDTGLDHVLRLASASAASGQSKLDLPSVQTSSRDHDGITNAITNTKPACNVIAARSHISHQCQDSTLQPEAFLADKMHYSYQLEPAAPHPISTLTAESSPELVTSCSSLFSDHKARKQNIFTDPLALLGGKSLSILTEDSYNISSLVGSQAFDHVPTSYTDDQKHSMTDASNLGVALQQLYPTSTAGSSSCDDGSAEYGGLESMFKLMQWTTMPGSCHIADSPAPDQLNSPQSK